jgi:hypothetical protein
VPWSSGSRPVSVRDAELAAYGNALNSAQWLSPALSAARECEVRQTLSMTQRPVGDPDKPSRRVVEQRVRNRIIEYLEVASSLEAQQEYERDVPIAYIPYEVINQWDDWVHKDPREDRDLSDVYDAAEVEAMGQFHAAWQDAASAVPNNYPRCLRSRRYLRGNDSAMRRGLRCPSS